MNRGQPHMTANNPTPLPSSLDADSEAPEPIEDPDALELREEFSEELRASLEAVAGGEATRSADEVAQRQGLAW